MLPEIRQEEGLYPVPKFEVEKIDIEGFMEELEEFHSEFADCFSRSEPRNNFGLYMKGQYSQLERKSIEPIALNIEGGKPRAMQFTISDAHWDEEKMLEKYHRLVKEDFGDPEGVLIFDESGFQKKGEESAGVSRQYCGSLGKVENCQVGVFGAYVSRHGYCFLDKRLFVPEKCFEDDQKKKREKLKFPPGLNFKTKPQLAAEMFEGIVKKDIIPFKYVAADTIYGESDDFIEAVESHPEITYFVEISCDTLCWLNTPVTDIKRYKYKKENRTREVVAKNEKKPIRVEELARGINNVFWYRRVASEGAKGPIEYEFSKRNVILCKKGLPSKNVWLIMKRTPDKKNYWFYISNALLSVRLPTFVWLSGIRWAIEQCFQEAKTELGMDHYEVRKFSGWNHHILTCILAHYFLWHLRIRLGKKSSAYYFITA